MNDFDRLTGHRYTPGYEPTWFERYIDDLLNWGVSLWITIAIILFSIAAWRFIKLIRKLKDAMKEDEETPRNRTDAEKAEHIRHLRKMRTVKD